ATGEVDAVTVGGDFQNSCRWWRGWNFLRQRFNANTRHAPAGWKKKASIGDPGGTASGRRSRPALHAPQSVGDTKILGHQSVDLTRDDVFKLLPGNSGETSGSTEPQIPLAIVFHVRDAVAVQSVARGEVIKLPCAQFRESP